MRFLWVFVSAAAWLATATAQDSSAGAAGAAGAAGGAAGAAAAAAEMAELAAVLPPCGVRNPLLLSIAMLTKTAEMHHGGDSAVDMCADKPDLYLHQLRAECRHHALRGRKLHHQGIPKSVLPYISCLVILTILATKNVTMTMCDAPIRDRTAAVWVAGVVGGVLAVVAFTIRMMTRLPLFGGQFGLDDLTMVLVMVCLQR
jgi:hypothetical protein